MEGYEGGKISILKRRERTIKPRPTAASFSPRSLLPMLLVLMPQKVAPIPTKSIRKAMLFM